MPWTGTRPGIPVAAALVLAITVLLGSHSLAFAQDVTMSTSLQSVSYPDRYIRHKDFLGYLDPVASDLDRRDASFVLVPGLADSHYFSFRSVNYPGHYLRHQNFAIKLLRSEGSDRYKEGATFKMLPGLFGEGGVTFESVNYPGHFLRQRNFRLYIDRSDGSELFTKDATFRMVSGLAP